MLCHVGCGSEAALTGGTIEVEALRERGTPWTSTEHPRTDVGPLIRRGRRGRAAAPRLMASSVVRLPPALAVRTAFRGQRARSSVNGGVLESRQPTVPRALRVTVVRVVRRLVVPVDPGVRTETLASQGLLDPPAITRKAGVTRHREHRESRGTYLPRSPMMSPLPSSTGPLAGASGRSARTMPTASRATW